MSELISCNEIAKIAGLTPCRIRQLGILPKVKKKTGKHAYMYDRKKTLDNWHKKRAERTGIRQKITTEVLNDAENNLFIAFMKGDFDMDDKKQCYSLKKLASKHTQPKTTTVTLIRDW